MKIKLSHYWLISRYARLHGESDDQGEIKKYWPILYLNKAEEKKKNWQRYKNVSTTY